MGRLTNRTDDDLMVPALGLRVPAHGGVDVDDELLAEHFPDGHPVLSVRVGDAHEQEPDDEPEPVKPVKSARSGRKES